mmetsp:Transcript_11299/g.20428  ORF Transcript_11299/g.20428 Transcript_11299/m.20428 type:complete len:269 (-) Transcript_11299:1007-1813(-)
MEGLGFVGSIIPSNRSNVLRSKWTLSSCWYSKSYRNNTRRVILTKSDKKSFAMYSIMSASSSRLSMDLNVEYIADDKKLVLKGPWRQNTFWRLYSAIEESSSKVVHAVSRADKNTMTFVSSYTVQEQVESMEKLIEHVKSVYDSLDEIVMKDEMRGFMEYEVNEEEEEDDDRDYENGFTVFVDNSASPVHTTITLGCFEKEGYSKSIADVFCTEGLLILFASMNPSSPDEGDIVRTDSFNVLDSSGNRLDEPSRARVQRSLFHAISSL